MAAPVNSLQTHFPIEESIKNDCVSLISRVALSSLAGIAGFAFFSRNYSLLLTAGIVCYNITDFYEKNKKSTSERPRADSDKISGVTVFTIFLMSLITFRY